MEILAKHVFIENCATPTSYPPGNIDDKWLDIPHENK